jgi:hypothetical protein
MGLRWLKSQYATLSLLTILARVRLSLSRLYSQGKKHEIIRSVVECIKPGVAKCLQ